ASSGRSEGDCARTDDAKNSASSAILNPHSLWLRPALRALTFASLTLAYAAMNGDSSQFCRPLLCGHQRNCDIQHSITKSPFIVIPAGGFHQSPRHFRQRPIEDRRAGIVVEVRR